MAAILILFQHSVWLPFWFCSNIQYGCHFDSVPTFSMAVILILFQYGMTVFWLPEMFLNLILKIHCTMWIQSLKEWF
jgi:hypothetical protein